MQSSTLPLLRVALVLGGAVVAGLGSPSSAAPPEVSNLFPAGGQRGQTVEVTAAGKITGWPLQVWTDYPGVAVKALKKKGQLSVELADDAAPGVCWLRLYDDEGGSPLRPFIVGTIAEANEKEPNDDYAKPQQPPSGPVVVNAKFDKSGDVDHYAIQLRAGQTLVASIEANQTLGSPADATLQIVDSRGFVFAHDDDTRGLDPQIVFTAPRDGTFLVRAFAFPAAPNSTVRYAGGADYIYRLTMTTAGFVEYAWPLAVSREAPGEATLQGWNISPDLSKLKVPPPGDADSVTLWRGELAGVAETQLTSNAVAAESPNEPSPVFTPPVTITGRVAEAGQEDTFRFHAGKRQALTFRVESRGLGFPLDPALRLRDEAGGVLREADDDRGGFDVTLSYTFASEGDYEVAVRDVFARGGPRYVYRLTIEAPQPDFSLSVAADHFSIPAGKPLEIPITVARTNGFSDEIEIFAEGLPEGVTAKPVKSAAKGSTAKSVKLVLRSEGKPASGNVRLAGRSTKDEKAPKRLARAAINGLTAKTSDIWITAAPPAKKK